MIALKKWKSKKFLKGKKILLRREALKQKT